MENNAAGFFFLFYDPLLEGTVQKMLVVPVTFKLHELSLIISMSLALPHSCLYS